MCVHVLHTKQVFTIYFLGIFCHVVIAVPTALKLQTYCDVPLSNTNDRKLMFATETTTNYSLYMVALCILYVKCINYSVVSHFEKQNR